MFKEYKRALSFIFNSFKWHKKLFIIFLIWKMIEWIFYVILPIFAKLEMDQLAEKNKELFWFIHLNEFNIFLVILGIIFFISFLENILKSFINFFQYDYLQVYNNFYSKSLYDRLQKTEPWFFLNSRNKRFVNEILWNNQVISNTMRTFIGDLITNSFVLIWIVTVLTLISIWFFVILIISWILIFFLESFKEKIIQKVDFEKKYTYEENIYITTNQLSRNFNQLISSGGFLKVLDKFDYLNEKIRKKVKESQKTSLFIDILMFFMENISEVLIKIMVWYSIFYSGASIWTMTMTILYVDRINSLIYFFRRVRFQFIEFKENLWYLNLFLDITEPKVWKDAYKDDFKTLEFKNVSFSYPNFVNHEIKYLEIFEKTLKAYGRKTEYSEEWLFEIEEARKTLHEKPPIILKNINLKFEKWQTYGLVWENWAWKTTIISLLQNFFENYEGSISIDSEEIKNFSRKFFEENISIINQIPYIIEGFTVRENILLGVFKEVSDEEIFELLEKFSLKKKILKMRKWLDSKIGYDNNFSGWEQQILVLIRIILQDKKILIMDEWTNQLDADNELKVMNELLKYKNNKIVIFITHRMTSIKKVDKIFTLKNGKIESSWTHNELIWKNNIYNDFWQKQVW